MPQIDAKVIWPDGQSSPSVDKDPITVPASNGATVIQWKCGTNVASFQISGLSATEFSDPASNGAVTVFTTTDQNNDPGTYTYTVTATHTTGKTASHDPKIENGSGEQ